MRPLRNGDDGTLDVDWGPTVDCDGFVVTVVNDHIATFSLTEADAAVLIQELAEWLHYRADLRGDLQKRTGPNEVDIPRLHFAPPTRPEGTY